jgi:hypothetical protein
VEDLVSKGWSVSNSPHRVNHPGSRGAVHPAKSDEWCPRTITLDLRVCAAHGKRDPSTKDLGRPRETFAVMPRVGGYWV